MIERLAYRGIMLLVVTGALWLVVLTGLIALMVLLGRPISYEALAKLAFLLVVGGLLATEWSSNGSKRRAALPLPAPELTLEERRGLLIELEHWERRHNAGTISDAQFLRQQRRILGRLGVHDERH